MKRIAKTIIGLGITLFLLGMMTGCETANYSGGRTALMRAAWEGDTETVEHLLSNGAEVNAKDNNGWTALMVAAGQGYIIKNVQVLLANGAEVNAKNNGGVTALMVATGKGHTEAVQVLLANGAEVNAKSNKGATALMIAEVKGHTEIVNLLKNAGAKE